MVFLKFLFIFFLILYLLSLIFKYFIKRFVKKAQKNFEERTKEYQNTNKQEGEVTVDYKQNSKTTIADSKGEYIDFEEVDD